MSELSAAQALKNLISLVDKEARKDGENLFGNPGHCHSIPGKWDRDGSVCKSCEAWDAVRKVAKEPAAGQDSPMLTAIAPALRQFMEAQEFMAKAKADKTDGVYETGVMRDAYDWVVSAGDSLFKALVEAGFSHGK